MKNWQFFQKFILLVGIGALVSCGGDPTGSEADPKEAKKQERLDSMREVASGFSLNSEHADIPICRGRHLAQAITLTVASSRYATVKINGSTVLNSFDMGSTGYDPEETYIEVTHRQIRLGYKNGLYKNVRSIYLSSGPSENQMKDEDDDLIGSSSPTGEQGVFFMDAGNLYAALYNDDSMVATYKDSVIDGTFGNSIQKVDVDCMTDPLIYTTYIKAQRNHVFNVTTSAQFLDSHQVQRNNTYGWEHFMRNDGSVIIAKDGSYEDEFYGSQGSDDNYDIVETLIENFFPVSGGADGIDVYGTEIRYFRNGGNDVQFSWINTSGSANTYMYLDSSTKGAGCLADEYRVNNQGQLKVDYSNCSGKTVEYDARLDGGENVGQLENYYYFASNATIDDVLDTVGDAGSQENTYIDNNRQLMRDNAKSGQRHSGITTTAHNDVSENESSGGNLCWSKVWVIVLDWVHISISTFTFFQGYRAAMLQDDKFAKMLWAVWPGNAVTSAELAANMPAAYDFESRGWAFFKKFHGWYQLFEGMLWATMKEWAKNMTIFEWIKFGIGTVAAVAACYNPEWLWTKLVGMVFSFYNLLDDTAEIIDSSHCD